MEASPDRVTAPCAYFGTCGGCQWQHASYEAQLRFKRGIVAEQLRRIGHFEDADGLVLPTIGMAEPWHYRNHARFTVGRRFGELCFTRSGTRQLLRIDHCWLMQPPDRRDPGPTPAPAARLPRPSALDPRRRQHRRPPDPARSCPSLATRSRSPRRSSSAPATRPSPANAPTASGRPRSRRSTTTRPPCLAKNSRPARPSCTRSCWVGGSGWRRRPSSRSTPAASSAARSSRRRRSSRASGT